MALTPFQRALCIELAHSRLSGEQSYIAGGAALNESLGAPRLSRDLDLFHDTIQALEATWLADRRLLQDAGYQLEILRERTGFIEVEVSRDGDSVLLQWLRDSAFRFFPLVPHPELGLTLHPFDLATNKILALVGRIETRDWVDALTCHEKVAPLGILAWAACGKDEAWNPDIILAEASRNSRTSREEWNELEWDGVPPDLIALSTQWRDAISMAKETIAVLPLEEVGKAVLGADGEPCRLLGSSLRAELLSGRLKFHEGHIGGAWPQLK